jgi:hypothetical protein
VQRALPRALHITSSTPVVPSGADALLLKTNDEFFGEDELFDKFYFAPKAFHVEDAAERELQAMLTNDILDHELFTGILPVFEKMGELNIFAIRSGTVNGKVPKIGFAQRSTNFFYFKYRFAARQMQVTARFNPYIARASLASSSTSTSTRRSAVQRDGEVGTAADTQTSTSCSARTSSATSPRSTR